jgi:FSR family fosmidomycin resistance protein-like MFS transporter
MTLQADARAAAPTLSSPSETAIPRISDAPVQTILWTMSMLHFANDMLQSLISAILPILKDAYQLNFTQTSFIVSLYMACASLVQPFVGMYTDKNQSPWTLSTSMIATAGGVLLLTFANNYTLILLAAVLVGVGSAIFHPEGARMTRLAAGNKPGAAQSTFQVGGNFGQASGPLLAAFVVVPFGQGGIGWFALLAIAAFFAMLMVGRWAQPRMALAGNAKRGSNADENPFGLTTAKLTFIITILLVLMFSKSVYSVSISTFHTFYLMEKFAVPLRDAQLFVFLFMASVAAGVYFGGPLGDRFGRKYVIWFSILGALPFTVLVPYASLFWCTVLTVIIGFITSASMSQIIVYAMELAPRKVGLMAGLFFGFGFGMAGLGAVLLGILADKTSLDFVYKVCAWLPAIGILTVFLPNLKNRSMT